MCDVAGGAIARELSVARQAMSGILHWHPACRCSSQDPIAAGIPATAGPGGFMAATVLHRATVTREEGFLFRAEFDASPGAPPLRLDEPPPLGQAKGPNAADVLAAAVGNCLSASLLMCLQKSRADVSGLTTSATVRMERNEAGRLRIAGIEVEIDAALGTGDAAKLERCRGLFEDFCTVTASVRQGIPVHVTVKGR